MSIISARATVQCVVQSRNEHHRATTKALLPVSRREALSIPIASLIASQAILAGNASAAAVSPGDWSTPGLAAPEDDAAPKFFKTPQGIPVQQLAEGTGAEAHAGDKVLVDFVLRRANGYFIYATLEGVSFQPKDVPTGATLLKLDAGSTVEGLADAIEGMKEGGKRRILVPPQLGYTSSSLEPKMPTFATQRQLENHKSEPLLFELQLLRVLK